MIPHGTNQLQFQVDTGTNTNYNITNTSMRTRFYHKNDNSAIGQNAHDGPNSNDTNLILFGLGQKGTGTDGGFETRGTIGGHLYLYNPSSTVFEKHWIAKLAGTANAGGAHVVESHETAGYFQTTTAITRVRFKYNSGNIDAGRITMFGLAK
jgi:hypothetical protein